MKQLFAAMAALALAQTASAETVKVGDFVDLFNKEAAKAGFVHATSIGCQDTGRTVCHADISAGVALIIESESDSFNLSSVGIGFADGSAKETENFFATFITLVSLFENVQGKESTAAAMKVFTQVVEPVVNGRAADELKLEGATYGAFNMDGFLLVFGKLNH